MIERFKFSLYLVAFLMLTSKYIFLKIRRLKSLAVLPTPIEPFRNWSIILVVNNS